MDFDQAPELNAGSISKNSMDEWLSAVGDVHTRLTFRNESDRQFAGTMSTSSVGALRACSFRGTALTASRTRRDISSGAQGEAIMIWQFRGHSAVKQNHRETQLVPGTLAFLDLDTPYEVKCSDEYGQLVIHMPTEMLVNRLKIQGARNDFRGSSLSGGPLVAPWLAFIGTAFTQAQTAGESMMLGMYDPMFNALATLAAMSFGQSKVGASWEVLLNSVRKVVEADYWRPDFTAEYVAGVLHLSRRTLFRALEEGQVSLSGLLFDTRMAAAAGMLRNEACSLTVEAVGLAVGYQSASTFHVRFREAFGVSPGAYRRQSLATGTHSK